MTEIELLAAEISKLSDTPTRRRYSAELKARIGTVAENARSCGMKRGEIARGLGVSTTLLSECLRRQADGWRQIRVVKEIGTISVYGPRGLRIEGLELRGVAELVRILG